MVAFDRYAVLRRAPGPGALGDVSHTASPITDTGLMVGLALAAVATTGLWLALRRATPMQSLGDGDQKKELKRRFDAAYRAEQKVVLDRLRGGIAALRTDRQAALRRIALQAREAKEAVRARYAAEIGHAEKTLRDERRSQGELRRFEQSASRAHRPRSTMTERRRESDQAVRNNLPEELWPLWAQAKAQIHGSSRRTRTEEFLEYVEENPEHAQDARIAYAEAELARTLARHQREERQAARRARPPLEEAPF